MTDSNGDNRSPGAAEPLVTVNRARVQFGSLVAVHDLSFQLHAGDLVGLIGPNGAGKTTLLRAMAGLQPLTSGEVLVMGERVLPGATRPLGRIGFTADNPSAYEELTVRQFLGFIGRAYGVHRDLLDEKIDFWLEQVWLKEKACQKIKALSRGMRQRIGIARTLLPNPTVVLLDEPAAGLDPAGRVQFRKLLASLREQGKTLIVSSHILADMNEYCTHIGIMAKGSLLQYGTVAQIAGAGRADRRLYTLVLAEPLAGVADILRDMAHVSHVQVEREEVTFEFPHDKVRAARLLADLIRQGVPVAGFTANAPDLEEAYLRTGIRQVD
ncbi:MAG: ABC transporter ATP-binding protein [Phycisphaerae bacterium]